MPLGRLRSLLRVLMRVTLHGYCLVTKHYLGLRSLPRNITNVTSLLRLISLHSILVVKHLEDDLPNLLRGLLRLILLLLQQCLTQLAHSFALRRARATELLLGRRLAQLVALREAGSHDMIIARLQGFTLQAGRAGLDGRRDSRRGIP